MNNSQPTAGCGEAVTVCLNRQWQKAAAVMHKENRTRIVGWKSSGRWTPLPPIGGQSHWHQPIKTTDAAKCAGALNDVKHLQIFILSRATSHLLRLNSIYTKSIYAIRCTFKT